jgi:predicted methyltransferase
MRKFLLILFMIQVALGTWSWGPQAEESLVPPSPKFYKGRRIAEPMHSSGADWLVRAEREREEHSSRLLGALGIKPGDTVCDLGCGNGFYSLKLAPLVGQEGIVLAVDIQQKMLDLLMARAEQRMIHNIKPIRGTVVDPKLPQQGVDLLLMVDVYHELSHPEEMLRAIRASLKPEGRIVLVEFREEDPEVPIKPLHKMSKQQILKEIPPNGFKLVGEFDELPWQHVMFFARTDVWPRCATPCDVHAADLHCAGGCGHP